jgi:hypothetical protein
MEINSNAPVISRHEITISAPLESVWLVHTEIDSWPQWNPDIAKTHLIGPIAVGTVFRWETAGMDAPIRAGIRGRTFTTTGRSRSDREGRRRRNGGHDRGELTLFRVQQREKRPTSKNSKSISNRGSFS